MNIYTYYQNLNPQKEPENLWLLDVWKKSWSYYGWNPVVLTLDDAKRYPMYDQFHAKCQTYPTVNHKDYEMACYIRWLKMFDKSGWTTDFDVINYGFEPIDYQNDIISLTGSMGGSTIFGPNMFYQNVIDVIMNYTFDETVDVITMYDKTLTHVSDLTIMSRCLTPTKYFTLESRYGLDGYDKSPLVHYANYYVRQMNTDRKTAIESDPRSALFML